jgi:ArsR family transcriptional regulator, arsenate/arsenite/antimonite-responsive transcriptional repressor
MREILAIFKALADENRLRIVVALRGHELCLCQIVALLGLANSTVSRHMSILRQARLVESRKDGRWSYFRLAEKTEPLEAAQAANLVIEALAHDEKTRQDAKRLKQDFCRSHSESK